MSRDGQIWSALRNVIGRGKITRRDGATVQATTRYGRTVDGFESFPYGFAARGTEGTTLIVFEGGDPRRPIIYPVESTDGVPELQDNDAAMWTKGGGWIVVRAAGTVELFGTKFGGVPKVEQLRTQLQKNSDILQALVDTLGTPINEPGGGQPSAFHAALKIAVGANTPGTWDGIENEKVKHGDGT